MDMEDIKKTYRNIDDKKLITNRLKRVRGQIDGVIRMVDDDRYCNDILTQLSAIENSVRSLSNHILEQHLYICVSDSLENGNLDVIDELISIFKRFNNTILKFCLLRTFLFFYNYTRHICSFIFIQVISKYHFLTFFIN